MQTRIRLRAGVVVAVLAATALVVSAARTVHADAQAGPGAEKRIIAAAPSGAVPAGFASWAEVFAVQDRLNAAAKRIVAAGGPDSGYAGIVAAPQNRDLRVYWKGAVPAQLRQLTGGLGVPVRFLPARFTQREMLAEAGRLAADPQVLSVGPEVDGSGLTATLTAAGQQALRSRVGVLGTARMPLHVGPDSTPRFLNRQNDISPHWGGARFNAGHGPCTSGFGVEFALFEHWITAGHCGNDGDHVRDGGGDLIGDTFNKNAVRDTMLIQSRFLDVTFEDVAYTGPFDSSNGYRVLGATEDFVGNLVCTSGATSGEHCDIPVTHVNVSALGAFPMVRAALPAGCAAAAGDSGGPVYSIGEGGVVGRGTISIGVGGTASCPNSTIEESSRIVYYAPLLRPPGDGVIGSLQFYGAEML